MYKSKVKEYYDLYHDEEFNEELDRIDYSFEKSLVNKMNDMRGILSDYITREQSELIIHDKRFIEKMIPPGLKGVKRGNAFNTYVYNKFKSCIPEGSIIKQEYKHSKFDEILDLYIQYQDKELCIYNQIDLFGGGAQLNRASKYLHTEGIVCVILNYPIKSRPASKIYKLMDEGLKNNKIIFPKYIPLFCREFFEQK
jgi:hypothetical protein